ncbi:phage holin family protein [Methylophilus medardicus]|uniref:Phage holin family protein n=1 Tax=Methylophilus medardicus TaxID=2588534 RepID=A0A5B8CQB9_9PROT|nr:phage holin family protein [Methylophilus medardicus]QDC43266.1 phage holin family protein [Methylophilus medardicus]QDC48273.1 phage holin family protein [Methylophilus medardicus]QDC51978.1 phage holin family protein [Methylophilus medardicus]
MLRLLVVWVLNALALMAVAYLVPGIHIANFTAALLAAVVIGFANVLVKPILVILTLPITLLTLGLFLLVINGLLFWFVGHLLQGFSVNSVLHGVIGALVYSVISWLLSAIVLNEKE